MVVSCESLYPSCGFAYFKLSEIKKQALAEGVFDRIYIFLRFCGDKSLILKNFLDAYPPLVKYHFGKPAHHALLITKTYTGAFSQKVVNKLLSTD
jgi:hypothetical protein